MANPKQQIHNWLMQQQMPMGIGAKPGTPPGRFAGAASLSPEVLGASSRFGAPMAQTRPSRFTRPAIGEPRSAVVGTADGARLHRAPMPGYYYGEASESELPAPKSPSKNFESRYNAEQRLNGAPVALDPEENVSEALLYAQDENRMAPVSYADNIGQQIRKFPVDPVLQRNISQGVYKVYGPGHSIVVGSGGQPGAGTDLENTNMTRDPEWTDEKQKRNPLDKEYKGRVGSTRHDWGHGADFRVIGPNGEAIHGEELAKLGQYWTASELGGVGLQMAGRGIHLDDRTKDELGPRDTLSWDYGHSKGGVYTPAMDRRIQAGLAGKMPELYQSPGMPAPSMSAAELGIEDPAVGTVTARMHGTFDNADRQSLVDEAYQNSKLMPADPYRALDIPRPKPRPTSRDR